MSGDLRTSIGAWLEAPTRQALDAAMAVLEEPCATRATHGDLTIALGASQPFRDARTNIRAMAVHLPLLVHAAITGETAAAVPLASALLVMEAGVYLLDHMMDGELAAPLDAWSPGTQVLAATSLLSYVPQQLLTSMPCTAERLRSIQHRLAEGMRRIRLGQAIEIECKAAGRVTLASAEESVNGKTGERRALYATLAAILAGADAATVAAYEGYGMSLGIARQINSDLVDLFGRQPSRDLAGGIRTWPLALYIDRAEPADRDRMLLLLELARNDQAVVVEIRERLRASGCLREMLLRKEVHCQRALRLLAEVKPLEPAAQELRDAVKHVSMAA
ncbi:polyprenyl synthetase family protein [Burkholderia sp. SCN-KJ]|uniref:polyprenyl synthetase family protein n=1 Tax=Burkholderia sp. SCN-KJ TaxID=2969248 RepID=UPI00214F7FF5|nr:polyprenyl synthetase family protein [Burkholderia sp. SCN-KJ]MCR4468309.1 polyprenyl synthetase family protein [Burkholderia sp. SCN-KJ]